MENQKHILFISSWYPNRTDPTHGIFNRYFAEAAAIHSKVSILHVCSDELSDSDHEYDLKEEHNITTLIVYYKKVTSRLPLFSLIQKRKRLLQACDLGFRQLLEKNGMPDLIQLNVVMPAGIGAYRLSQQYNIPYVINEGWSGYCPEDGNYKGILQKFFTEKIIASAKAIMPVSDHLKNAMLAHGLTGHYEVVPNVVDIHLFVPQPKPVSTITTFIHISTLDDVQKNVSGIIRAFEIAHRSNPQMELVIVGDGSDKQTLQALVKTLMMSGNIHFKGNIKIEDIVKEINASDALIMFSNYETFSLVVAESFACGKPVITSRAGGLTDFVTPDLGITIEKNNEEQLAEAILHFSKNKSHYDTAHIRQLVTENYSTEKIAEQLDEIYDEVLLVERSMNNDKQKRV